jgi:transposase InsO family protein
VKGSLDELFTLIGVPDVYKTDNGPPFQSYQFAEFAASLGLAHQRITPSWPRANGEVESFMKNLGKVLRTAAITGKDKEVELRQFLKAYRETPHLTTGVAPAKLMFVRYRTSGLPELEEFDFDKLKE